MCITNGCKIFVEERNEFYNVLLTGAFTLQYSNEARILFVLFLCVGELVLFKTIINNSIYCNYFTETLVYYNICCIFVENN